MMKDCPVKCVFSGQIGKVIGYEDYYFENERVLCMRAFSTSAVATTSMTMPPLRAALNTMTTQATIARYQRPFTRHSVPMC